MIIEIDCRENGLIKLLNLYKTCDDLKDINIIEKQLPLGDIIIKNNDDVELLIIERKSTQDLIASIKDGRYKEQSQRLSATTLHNHNIIYLIEGNLLNVEDKWKNVVYGVVFSLNYYQGFSVWNTLDNLNSAKYIIDITNKLQKNLSRTPFYNSDGAVENNQPYVPTIKRVKSENINRENINLLMLSQIPNVSTKVAEIILNKFSTIFELKRCLDEDPDCLNDTVCTLSNGQTRKISKNSIENIKKFIL